MAQWDSNQYLKFQSQRTQPAIDLAKRLAGLAPQSVLDIGCGPGNSTAVLREAFPQAHILGVDNSENMIEKARKSYPEMDFQLCDVAKQADALGKFDVIFSNACLQWIPDHQRLLPMIFDKLNDHGVLAVQIPMNKRETLFQIMDEITAQPQWGFSALPVESNGTLRPEEYFDILSSLTGDFDIWETVYYHAMPSVEAMVEWVKGTRLRPYLNVLDPERGAQLEQAITRRAAEVYRPQANGEYIFRFRRLFFTAKR